MIQGTSLAWEATGLGLGKRLFALEDPKDLCSDRLQPPDVIITSQSNQTEQWKGKFVELYLHGVQSDPRKYAPLLRWCGKADALSLGKLVHQRIIESGLDQNLFLVNLLLEMYGNCEALEDANALFFKVHRRDLYSWNFMIRACALHGQGKKAIELFIMLQQEGVIPDKYILVSVLSACACQEDLAEGQRIHFKIVCSELDSDVVVATALLSMYGKCGSLEEARRVFDNMHTWDVVSWNTMIAACSQHGKRKYALQVFDEMQQKGMMPDHVTFVCTFEACAKLSALFEGKQLHARALGSSYESNLVLVTALINMYGKCGSMEDARRMFDRMSDRNSISWNAIIAAYAQQGWVNVVLELFQRMHHEGAIPSKATYVSILDACASQSAIGEGKLIHARIMNSEFESDIVLGTALLNMYGKGGSLDDASRMFNKIRKETVVSWNAMITAYTHNGQAKEAFQMFKQMQLEGIMPDKITFLAVLNVCANQTAIAEGRRMHSYIVSSGFESNVVLGTALISMYAKCGILDDAQKVFDRLPEWNEITFISILSALATLADLMEGRRIHSYIRGSLFKTNVKVGTALVSMYAKCGSLEDAQRTFDEMPKQDVILWNAMLSAYNLHGQPKNALKLFNQMQRKGVTPDEVTFISVLSACSYAGLMSEGCHFFNSMKGDYGIIAKVDHYNCMVDLFGRVGKLDEAEHLISKMPVTPNVVTWTTLLVTCQKTLDVKRGEHAARHIIELGSDDASPYVMLSNIYAAAGLGEDAAKLMAKMRATKLNDNVDDGRTTAHFMKVQTTF